jgi:2-dehydro-3-deoxyphosphogluconate aldolase/(4S)-4-hydroxy-2-oxoglutarate aldolase
MMDLRVASGGPADATASIGEAGLVAVLRASVSRHLEAVAHDLVAAGIRIVEVTLTTPDAVSLIKRLHAQLGRDALVGAGTVVTLEQAEACIDAGADFLVSPTTSLDVVATARIAGVAAYPGAFTPTEILTAQRSGVSAVKLFPAASVGPGYLRQIRAPLPDIAIMPTGGIALTEVEAWLRAGAAAVGLGTSLSGRACEEGTDPALKDRARIALDGVAAARQEG